MERPKLFTLRNYTWAQLQADVSAGVVVGIVALPLALAFAIASGVDPIRGIWTAVIGGAIISVFGGSRVQIGGPTGAFVVVVYGIMRGHGIDGLLLATAMAGVLLLLLGLARMGSYIRLIPEPVITGFTAGIAIIIGSSQIRDLFGLHTGALPGSFVAQWQIYLHLLPTLVPIALILGAVTVAIVALWPSIRWRVPGSLIALLLVTIVVQRWQLPVETIGSRFGVIHFAWTAPKLPHASLALAWTLLPSAIAIALLGAIESLLSASVADRMVDGHHRSNVELLAQGAANIASAAMGGIPATGAIARTATNVRNGGRTPVSGLMHSLTLLLIMLAYSRWVTFIPMAAMAGILLVVAYQMSDWRTVRSQVQSGWRAGSVVVVTALLTVLVNLPVAIGVGIVVSMVAEVVLTGRARSGVGESGR